MNSPVSNLYKIFLEEALENARGRILLLADREKTTRVETWLRKKCSVIATSTDTELNGPYYSYWMNEKVHALVLVSDIRQLGDQLFDTVLDRGKDDRVEKLERFW